MELYQDNEKNLIRHIAGWIVDIAVTLALAWFFLYAFGTQVKLAGQSMAPLLESDDVVLMNRLSYDFGNPKRFDVIVFERDDHKTNVKRVIGLPGETIQIKDGTIFINQERLQEDSLNQVSLAGTAEDPVTLGEDEYFILGDNRESSEDSRFINIGNIKRKQILGKIWFRILPFIDAGPVFTRP